MRSILILTTVFLFASRSFAQGPDNLNGYANDDRTFTFHDIDCDYFVVAYNCYESKRMLMEVPPWQIAGGWLTYFFSNGNETNTYSDPHDMISTSSANIEGHGPYFAKGPNADYLWKRNYSEIYSAHSLQHPSEGLVNIGFCHGENKDWNGQHNTINPDRPIDPSIPANTTDWDAYYGILHAAWTPSNQSNNWGQQGYNNELGPILWPSNGYVNANNESATAGLRHPSSIVWGDYVYVFITDAGPNHVTEEEGREGGVKLVRAHINNVLNPSAYEVYYKDLLGNVNWLPSLPPNFTKETMLDFVKIKGPKSSNILPDLVTTNSGCIRFSVAHVNGTGYFAGLEEYLDAAENHHIAIRFSYDLMTWTPRRAEIEWAAGFGASDMNYPIFLSADGWSNTDIDLNDFYVIGTRAERGPKLSTVFMKHIYLPPPPPPPPSVCYDQCGNPVQCPAPPYCPDCWCPEARKAITGTAKEVDNSKERAPFVAPNPGPGVYRLKYTLKAPAKTQLIVQDLMGRQVQADAAVSRLPGTYIETVNISGHAKGVYLLQLLVNGKKQTFKVIYQ